jgi:hypothetical protein
MRSALAFAFEPFEAAVDQEWDTALLEAGTKDRTVAIA